MPDNILKVNADTRQRQLNTKGAGGGPLLNPSSFFTERPSDILARGNAVSGALNTIGNTAVNLANIQRRREARDEKVWVQQQSAEGKQHWLTWLNDVNNREKETFDEDFLQGINDELDQRLEEAPTQGARDALSATYANFRNSVLPSVLRQTAVVRTQNTQAILDNDIQSLSDTLPFIEDPAILQVQQEELATLIDAHVEDKSLSNNAGVAYKKQLADLTLTYGISLIGKNNELAEQVIKNAKNVDANRRLSALRKIETSNNAVDKELKFKLREDLSSDLAEARKFGTASRLDVGVYEDVFGKQKAEEAERLIKNASTLFEAEEQVRGAQPNQWRDILATFDVDRLASMPLDEQVAMQQEIQGIIASQQSLFSSDPVVYFSQSQEVINMMARAEATADEDSKKVLQDQISDHIVEQQMLAGVPDSQIRVMTNAEAEAWASQINGSVPTSSDGQISTLAVLDQLATSFEGDNFFRAYSHLASLPASKRVKPELLTALWHKDNPPMFEAIVNSIRKDGSESENILRRTGKLRELQDDVATNALLQSYRASLVTADDSPLAQELMSGTYNAFYAYARDRLVNGQNVEQSAKTFFGSLYDFDEVNGRTYAIRKQYTTVNGERREMTEDQVTGLKAYLEESLSNRERQEELLGVAYEEILGPNAGEVELETLKDSLSSTAFWLTNSSETGVILYINGDAPGSAQQLKTADGKLIEIPFHEIAQPFTYINQIVNQGQIPRRSDDKWYDKFFKGLGKISGS